MTNNGGNMNNRKPRGVAALWGAIAALALGAVLTGGAYTTSQAAAKAAAQLATIEAQAATIETLSVKMATVEKRLGICLGSTSAYREYALENVAIQADIAYKYGPNYMVPVKDIYASYETAAAGLECS